MATSGPTQLPAFFNTDQDFRDFVAGIRAGLVAAGLTVTGDTGQINAATVAKPAAINTAQGYDIFRFSDTLQATRPIYIKVEYGSGASVATRPGIWVTVGTGSNGSGTLTGQVGARVQVAAASNAAAGNTLPAYFSGAQAAGDARINCAINVNLGTPSVNYIFGFAVERLLDASGTPTGDGIFTYMYGPSGANFNSIQIIPTPAGSIPAAGQIPHVVALENGGGATSFGGDVTMSPIIAPMGKVYVQSCILAYKSADIGGGSAVTCSIFGASHTYMPWGDANKGTDRAAAGTASSSHAMRWE